MEIRTVRKSGERGTQRLVAEYGERLVCVRYRYDLARNKRYKTVELIVAEDDWRASAPHPQEDRTRRPAPKRYYTGASASASSTKRRNCADRSRRQAGCGTLRNGCGLFRRKKSAGWGWCRESPNDDRYYM